MIKLDKVYLIRNQTTGELTSGDSLKKLKVYHRLGDARQGAGHLNAYVNNQPYVVEEYDIVFAKTYN